MLLAIWLGWFHMARATIHVWNHADSASFPKTITSAYEDDTIQFTINFTATANAFIVTGNNVTFDGNGNVLFYRTGGGNGNEMEGFEISGDNCEIYDMTIIHDPENDGEVLYTASNVTVCTALWLANPYGFIIKR